MIVDCFTFFDELDLLELRLLTLDAVVDKFVLCEAPFTFRGKPKPLHFAESAERFSRWKHKIVPLVYHGPTTDDPWENEWRQRDFLSSALQGCSGDDLVMLSDCDEIPDPRNVGTAPHAKLVLAHRQRMSVGYVNRISRMPWLGTRTFRWKDIATYGRLRDVRLLAEHDLDIVEGGWHFSYLGGADAIARKLTSYAHTEFDLPYFTDRRRIEIQYASGLDAECVPIDETFPRALADGARWSAYVWSAPPDSDRRDVDARQHAHGCFAYVPADATSVTVFSESGDVWSAIGNERFGAAFAGVSRGSAASFRPLPRGTWCVVDGLQRAGKELWAALARPDLGIVAYLRNARSFKYFDGLLAGMPAEPGRALGRSELAAWAQSNGRTVTATDRIFSAFSFIPWAQMSAVIAKVQLTRWASFEIIERDALADFMAEAFVTTIPPID